MITVQLNENSGVKLEGIDLFNEMGITHISTPANLNSFRDKSPIWNIPFNWRFGTPEDWNAGKSVVLTYEDSDYSIMGQDFYMVNTATGADKYTTSDGGINPLCLDSLIYIISNYDKQIIEEYFPAIGIVTVSV